MITSRRTLKLMALGYVVKTIVFGVAWLAVPVLPQRAMTRARVAWEWVRGTEPAPAAAALPR